MILLFNLFKDNPDKYDKEISTFSVDIFDSIDCDTKNIVEEYKLNFS